MDLTIPSTNLQPTSLHVPNLYPLKTATAYKIAIIGEAPGEEEVERRRPFVGASGRLLDVVLANAGIERDCCFVGNIVQHRPPNNDITKFSLDGPEFTSGVAQLTRDLDAFNPHLCILLGNTPLRIAKGNEDGGKNVNIGNWRGSLFRGLLDGPFRGRKCIAALHPAAVLRNYADLPLLRSDLGRARLQGASSDLVLPNRVYDLDLSADEIIGRLHQLKADGKKISLDIEGWVDKMGVRCVSLTNDISTGFIIAFEGYEPGTNRYSFEDEIRIWVAFSELMWDRSVEKVLQNSLYDRFVLAWLCHVLIRNIVDDTMVKHWELYCELEKDLGLLTSIYTYEPFYKGDHKASGHKLWKYCCTDSAVTLECNQVMDKQMLELDRKHYAFNMAFLEVLFYFELRGLGYDQANADKMKLDYQTKAYELQDKLNTTAGRTLPFASSEQAFEYIVGLVCKKRSSPTTWDDLPGCTLKKYQDSAHAIASIGSRLPNLTAAERGELSYHLGLHLNVSSTAKDGDMQTFLYKQMGYPIQYKKERGKKTDKVTSDVNAILALFMKFPEDRVLLDLLRMRSHLNRIVTLSALTDTDSRMRGAYNCVGAETGRVQVSTSPTGSGFNLQTPTSSLRVNFTADPDYDMFQVDLAGADGVTVAAWALYFGDPTMWDDYQAKLKPANIVALAYEFGQDMLQMSRDQLRWASREVDAKGWVYFACKQVQHGSSYKMGINTMSDNILLQSFKRGMDPVYVPPKICGHLQGYFFTRYWGIIKWQDYIADVILKTSKLTSASGHTRKFFGRKRENGHLNHDTWKQALADSPQNNTTYATNLPILRMYTDPENRQKPYQYRGPNTKRNHFPGALIIEPLHQIHDAVLGQWPQSEREWARKKVKEYFHNELDIAHRKVIIPYEGNWGPNWGALKEAL